MSQQNTESLAEDTEMSWQKLKTSKHLNQPR
jgi:hypothetical protein